MTELPDPPDALPSALDLGLAHAFEAEQAKERTLVPAARLPERLGAFEIVRLLGSGGMGHVYEATQEHPKRTVALKVVRQDALGEESLSRFSREANILARLTHRGIAQVYEAGTFDTRGAPQPYIAMEFIAGAEPLTAYAADRGLDLRAKLELFREICEAVDYGHQHGVIHRDLKPDNILVAGPADEPSVKVIDFGVARATGGDIAATSLRTNIGQLVGTLYYMSPEQVEADPGALDQRSDVYSLGVVLHELVTGRLPYELAGLPMLEMARVIRDAPPTRVTGTRHGLLADVDTITAKALEKEKGRRYASAKELSLDIRAALDGTPISARPASTVYKLQKLAQRNRGVTLALLALFVVLIVATTVSVRWAILAGSRARQVERELYRAHLNESSDAIESGRYDRAAVLLDSLRSSSDNWEWRHLASRVDPTIESPVPDGWRCPIVRYSHDGTRVMARAGRDGDPLECVVLDAASGRELLRIPEANDAEFTPDGEQLWVGRADGSFERWDIESKSCVAPDISRFHLGYFDVSIAASLGRYALIGAERIEIRDLESDALLDSIDGTYNQIEFDRDARWLFAIHDYLLFAFAAQGERPSDRAASELDFGLINTMAAHPTEPMLALGREDGSVRLISTSGDAPSPGPTLHGLSGLIASIGWSPDGEFVTAGATNDGKVWEAATGEIHERLSKHDTWIRTVEYAPTGELVTCDSEGFVHAWPRHRRPQNVLLGHSSYVYALDVSPDGERIVSGGWDGAAGGQGGLRLWDAASGATIGSVGASYEIVTAAAFDAHGSSLLVAIQKGKAGESGIAVLDPTTLERRLWFQGHGDLQPQRVVAFPNGRRVLSIDMRANAIVWDAGSGEVHGRLDGVPHQSSSPIGLGIDVRGDGAVLATVLAEKSIRLYDTGSYEPIRDWVAHEEPIWSIAFSPDGRTLVSASMDDSVRLWDTRTGRKVGTLLGHGADVLCAAFSPDGKRIASGGRDGYLRIWETEHLSEVVRLGGHREYIFNIHWSPDGDWVATASGDRTVRIWDTRSVAERYGATLARERRIDELGPRIDAALRAGSSADSILAELADDGVDPSERSTAIQVLQARALRERGSPNLAAPVAAAHAR